MKDIQSYLVNKDAPSGGFSVGKLKEDPGDSSGSGITVQTHNDYLYGFIAAITKYLGAVSDTNESDTASDVLDAHETMSGVKNPNVAEYDNGVTYAEDDHVMYLGLQFVSVGAGNVGNPPLDNPDLWIACFNRDDAVVRWRNGEDIKGGMEAMHDFRDGGYRQNYAFGQYNFGGDAGRNFEGFGVHLDGTVVTGDGTLEAIFDVGGAGEYHLLDTIAPDVVGTRTLLDARGRVAAAVDAGGGNRAIVGAAQEDAGQRITGHAAFDVNLFGVSGVFTAGGSALGGSTTGTDDTQAAFDSANSVSPNAAKTDDAETRMKNYSVGIPSVLVLNELP